MSGTDDRLATAPALAPVEPAARPCLNLPAIEASLRGVQRDFHLINAHLEPPRDPFGDDVLSNMLSGYAYVNHLVARGVDLFTMGQLRHVLELNALVLCGAPESRGERFAGHLAATERRFYEERGGGIRDLVEWYEAHEHSSAWLRAAGVYVRVLSEPQLFIEGNHRTGSLLMSYVLLRESSPPFVLSVENAAGYFDPSSLIRGLRKQSLRMLLQSPQIQRRFARFLQAQANAAYLVSTGFLAISDP